MNIAIIGGGITGLSAAYTLSKQGHNVTVFERESYLGGLAYGFKENPPTGGWDWHLEGAYHHLFTNDKEILGLMHELHLDHTIIVQRPVTASLYNGHMYQLDSPISLLRFPGLSLIDKLRTGALLGALKVTPFWQPLERITAEKLFISIGGIAAWNTIWEPLLYGKFGDLAPSVAASWLWARIKKRTPNLIYIEGGFHTFIEGLAQAIKNNGGKIYTGKRIDNLDTIKKQFDKILITIPTPFTLKLISQVTKLDARYSPLSTIPHLFAQTLILETEQPILKDVYWLNVTDRSYPFLAAVAHTNFMDKTHYGGHHLTYFGNYLPAGHPYLSMSKEQLFKKFKPFIQRLSVNCELKTINSYMYVAPYAQPVHQLHYSQKIPPIATPMPGVYMANMDYVYPWDRGTNYAVELGFRAANSILSSRA
jgi:protoporphyrinogen oxidase